MSKKAKVVPLVSKPEAMLKYLQNLAGRDGAYVLAYYGNDQDHFVVHNITNDFDRNFRIEVAADLTNTALEIISDA